MPTSRKRKKKSQPAKTRPRNLESIRDRGDRDGYLEACTDVVLRGPQENPIGATVTLGHWNQGNEWIEERYIVTPEAIDSGM